MSRKQWEQLRDATEIRYRWALSLCQWVVDHDMEIEDPLYQAAGKLLQSCIELRQVTEHWLEDRPLSKPQQNFSMMMWVRPQAGGGYVPTKPRPRRKRGRL